MREPDPATEGASDYANVTGRAPGALVRGLGRVLPGVATVQAQASTYAAFWHRANLATVRSPVRRWVVLGDSMSLGMGASSPRAGWVGQVQDRLRAAGVEVNVLNLAASGARVPDLLGQQLPAWRATGPRPDDVLTVLVGSNDLMSRVFREELPDGFATLVDALPSGSIVATLPQPRRAAVAANEHIEAARDLRVVDLRRDGPPSWRGKLAADHFHPNDAGYAGLADAFLPVVTAAFEDANPGRSPTVRSLDRDERNG